MHPILQLCVCLYLLSTCVARPNWHHGVAGVKDVGLPPLRPFAHSDHMNEAQIAAAQAIKDAGEDAQLHLAFLKKKYMDVVRQHFYNAFAPLPFIKERPGHIPPNLHPHNLQAVKNAPLQPLYVHNPAENNPCAGNIIYCLQANVPPRFGKIVPSSPDRLQPCFGPNCNHVSFDPQFKPMVIPKPSHTSHSSNKKPSKHPNKHHRICDRRRPDQNCHHQSTFWPSYATLKFSTKHSPSTTTVSFKDINHQDSLQSLQTTIATKESQQQHLILPSKFVDIATTPISLLSNADKLDIGTLRVNATKLENEILGIPENEMLKSGITNFITPATAVMPTLPETKIGVLTDSVSSTSSVLYLNTDNLKNINQPIPSTTDTATEISPELKEDSLNLPPLKTSINPIHHTPKDTLQTNDVVETSTLEFPKSTQVLLKSYEEENKSTTSSIFPESTPELTESNLNHLKTVVEADPSVKYEVSTIENMPVPTKNAQLESTVLKGPKELDSVLRTTAFKQGAYDTTTIFYQRVEEEKEEYPTTLLGDKKLELEPTTGEENSEWKSELQFIIPEEPLSEASPTSTQYGQRVLVTEGNDGSDATEENNQRTILATEYFSEDVTSLKTTREENDQLLYTTMPNKEEYDITQMFDSDLAETPVSPNLELIFENAQIEREFPVHTITRTGEDSTQSIQVYYDRLGQEDTDDSETTGKSDVETRTISEEATTSITLLSSSDDYKFFKETTIQPMSELSARLGEDLFSTTENSVTSNNHNQEAREETITDSYRTELYTSIIDSVQPTQRPDWKNEEISTQDNNIDGVSFMARENVLETVTRQEAPSKVEQLVFMSTEEVHTSSDASIKSQTEQSYFPAATESKESKINWENENNSFKPTIKNIEEWTTDKPDTTEYFSLAREEIIQDFDDPLYSLEETSLNQAPLASSEPSSTKSSTPSEEMVQRETTTSIARTLEFETDSATFLEDTISEVPYLTENEQLFSTLNSGSEILKLAEENETSGTPTSQTFIDDRVDITTNNAFNGLPQIREGGEEESLETSTNTELTDKWDEKSTLIPISENKHYTGAQDLTFTELTEVPERREDSSASLTTKEDNTETVPTESELKETVSNVPDELKEKSFESNLISPELFGKTDTPGLLISEDWTEEQTEDNPHSLSTELMTSEKSTYTGYPQSKEKEEGDISEVFPHFSVTDVIETDVTEDKGIISIKHGEPTVMVEVATDSVHKSVFINLENDIEATLENIEGTKSVNQLNEKPSLLPYQNGVLKFTTEIETRTGDVLNTEITEGSTNQGLALELNDSLNRKVRSVQQKEDEVQSYPTTECLFCMLGLPHGHRIKRLSEISRHDNATDTNFPSNETKVLQSDKSKDSNCSFSTNLNLEDPENSSFYASTILELLPVIREGYRNNAFSEDDKKVIRSLFGDMRALMDEDTFERITESTSDLLMGDGASRTDDIIEDIDYDSSEGDVDEMSENTRLKRSKKNFQLVNDLLKKIPGNSKNQFIIPSRLKNSRVVRSTHVTQAEASAILALLAEKGEAVQLDIADDEDDDEYEYYEDEQDDYGGEDSKYVDEYEDDYDEPSFGELIKLARRHRERKSRAEES